MRKKIPQILGHSIEWVEVPVIDRCSIDVLDVYANRFPPSYLDVYVKNVGGDIMYGHFDAYNMMWLIDDDCILGHRVLFDIVAWSEIEDWTFEMQLNM